jgi:hypothetical protein
MALSLTITGTSQNITATNGSPNITFASGVATNWVVGATIQGTGWATGTKILSITGTPATSTAAVLSNNFTGTTGTTAVIASSNNATAIFQLGASGDTATPQNIINLGLGAMPTGSTKTIQIFGRTYIEFRFVQGSTYDDTEWTYYLGLYSYMRVNETYTGTWRSGFILQGSTYIKAKGATIYYQQARAVQGGTSIGTNSGAPAGFPTNKLKLHWNDIAWIANGGTNYAMSPSLFYGEWYQCGDIIMDYWADGGANASFAGSYGSIEKLSMYKVIGGINQGFDATQITPIGKLEWFCISNGDTTGNNPDIKLGTPNNLPVSGIAPIFYQTNTSLTFIGVNSNASEIWDDYTLPTNYPILTNSRNYSAGNRTYRRTVNFDIKDSNNTALTGVTVYIKSGVNELYNAVVSGSNFNQKLRRAWVDWTARSPVSGSYIAPLQTIDNGSHVAQFRKYGMVQQTIPYSIVNAAYSQPVYEIYDSSLTSISEATATAVTTAGINWATKTITPTSNLSYDEINARLSYELALTANSAQADPRTISGSKLSLASGWTLVVNPGITINVGTAIKEWFTPTITNNGTIVGTYADSTGTFAKLLVNGLANGMVAKLLTGSIVLSSTTATGSSVYLGYFIPTGGSSISATLYVEKATGQANGYNLYTNTLVLGDTGATTTAIMSIDTFYGRSSGQADRANVSVTWNSTTGAPTITLSGDADVKSVYDVVLESHATTANITYNRPTTGDGFTYQFNNSVFTGTGKMTGTKQFFTTGGVSINYDLILNYLNTLNFLPNSWIKVIKSSDNSVLSPYTLNTLGKLELNMGTGIDYKVFVKKDGYKPLVVELNSGTGQALTLNQIAQAYYNAATDISALTPLLDVTNASGVLSIVSVGEMNATSLEVCAIIDYLQKDEDYADVALYAETGDIWEIISQYQNTPNPTYIKIERDPALTSTELTIWDTYFTSSSVNFPDTDITPIQSSTGLWVIGNRSAVGEVTIKNEQAVAISQNASEYVWSKVLENNKTANKNVSQSNNFDAITSIEVQKTN